MNRIFRYCAITICFHLGWPSAHAEVDPKALKTINKLVNADKPPTVLQKSSQGEVSSLYFAGEPYQGKATRIFAYYGTPKGKGPYPALVLVHGGGGSAYKQWVKKWNEKGFASISIAVEGQTGTQINKRPPNKWQLHSWAGPKRAAIYADTDKPLTDQWMFHATAATIRAHNLLRSFDEIKHEQIGLSGISWGGVISATVMGFDQRFAFAIPIYGSGFLDGMDNQYGKSLRDNEVYKQIWKPELRIGKFTPPTLWMTGLKETHFSLDAQANTYKLLRGKHYQSIQPKLKHSHKAGWTPKEPYEFAQAIINNHPIPNFYQQHRKDGLVGIKVINVKNLSSAKLYYTNDSGHTSKRVWLQHSVIIDPLPDALQLTATLPDTASAWFFNIEKTGLTYSSEFTEAEAQLNHSEREE